MKLLPKILALSLAMVVTTSVAANQLANEKTAISVNYKNNRYPLLQKPYIELPIGSIRPTGWMQEQLVRMGRMDLGFPKAQRLFRTGYRPELRTGITTGQFPGLVA